MLDADVFPPLVDRCWILTGPTASGKSDVALELVQRLDAEVVSLDSMTVYRQMNIGTAKPALADRQRVPHHIIDVIDPTEDFSVAQYLGYAHRAIQQIIDRGRTPLLVGGAPMYLKAIIRGFDSGPPADWAFRHQVQEDVDRYGIESLHKRLLQVDPLSAHQLHPHDVRRMTRALEVAYLTGKPLSHRQVQFEPPSPNAKRRVFALQWPRTDLHERINERVSRMFTNGLVEETQALLKRYGTLSRTASQAVGYGESIAHLQDQIPLSTTISKVQAHTRQLARRQETWFRSLTEIQPIQLTESISPTDVAANLFQLGSAQ